MSNLFNSVKENVSCLDVGQRYGLEPNNHGFCRCVFHAERTASLKLYPGTDIDDHSGFYCFGCHRGGDVITLVSGIFGIEPVESALMLAKDFCVPYDDHRDDQPDPEAVRQQKRQKQAEKALFDEIRRYTFITYDYLRELEKIVSEGNLDDPEYYPAICDIETVRYYSDIWSDGSLREKAELVLDGKEVFEGYERKLERLTRRLSGKKHEAV